MKIMATSLKAETSIEVFVKGDGSAQENGDCPFCQRILIQLQAKSLPYSLTFIDFDNKPAWWVTGVGRVLPVVGWKGVVHHSSNFLS